MKTSLTLGSSPNPYIMCCTRKTEERIITFLQIQTNAEEEKGKKEEKEWQLHSFWKTPRLRLKEVSEGCDDPVLCFEDGPADGLFIFTNEIIKIIRVWS